VSVPRWPLHPAPRPGEALSSWLERIAAVYGMQLHELADIDLGLPDVGGKPWESTGWDRFDVDPPAAVLARIHQRSGVPLAQLGLMCVAGWTPWLMDSLDPSLPEAFATYVCQDTVLFAAHQLKKDSVLFAARPLRKPESSHHPWRPWLEPEPTSRLRRACLPCVLAGGWWWSLLMCNMPVMLSCPEHGVRLMPFTQVRVAAAGYGDEEDVPDQVSEAVTAMDRRTHEGVTTGMVTLPRRTVHVGVWFRMLRRVLHEVTTPASNLRTAETKQALTLIWQTADLPQRAGQGYWASYEAMDWKRQCAMLEGAAVAMHLVEAGAITAHGTLGHLLLPEQDDPVGSSPAWPNPAQPDPWDVFMSDYNAILDAAISDRAASIELLRLFTDHRRTRGGYERGRSDLITCGLRAQFLPAWLDDGDRPDLDAAMADAQAAAAAPAVRVRIPGKVVDHINWRRNLSEAERSALRWGRKRASGQGYSLNVTARLAVHQSLLAAANWLGTDQAAAADRKAYRLYATRLASVEAGQVGEPFA